MSKYINERCFKILPIESIETKKRHSNADDNIEAISNNLINNLLLLKFVVDSSEYGVWDLDIENCVLRLNNKALQFLGLTINNPDVSNRFKFMNDYDDPHSDAFSFNINKWIDSVTEGNNAEIYSLFAEVRDNKRDDYRFSYTASNVPYDNKLISIRGFVVTRDDNERAKRIVGVVSNTNSGNPWKTL